MSQDVELIELGLTLSTAGRSSTNWSRRFKHNVERLKSGQRLKIAAVVRDLTQRQRSHPDGLTGTSPVGR